MSKTISAPKIFTDDLTRRLYANDASMYEVLPEAVAFPSSAEDIQELVRLAREKKWGITARTAGTSLAGQAVGEGLIVDFSRFMTNIGTLNVDKQSIDVEPGVIRDSLNRFLASEKLHFAPDTSTTNRCMIGGMIGNNSAGSFSIKYGTTRDHIVSLEAILSDGSLEHIGPMSEQQLSERISKGDFFAGILEKTVQLLHENAEAIRRDFPKPQVKRRNTGYPLDAMLKMKPFTKDGPDFNLAELLCGSEGTLALTAKAEVKVTPVDSKKLLVVPQFRTVHEAMIATTEIVKFGPSAVELVDDNIIRATDGNAEQRENRFFLQGSPTCFLIVQFSGDDSLAIHKVAQEMIASLEKKGLGYVFPLLTDSEKMERVWNLRKAGLGLLMGMKSDAKTPTFSEDTAVAVEVLPEYIRRFQQLLDKHNTDCVFYAHASVGELHLRPVINLRAKNGVEKMQEMAHEIALLVKEFGGSLSGEHGDGRVRSPLLSTALSREMVTLFEQLKHIWDPENVFNPGIIAHPKPMAENLRFTLDNAPKLLATEFKWRKEGSFAEAIESCNGAGVCRKLADSGGTMCPSYQATNNEKDSTRGRANVFRQLFAGANATAFEATEVKKALSLCLSCKACKTECPANVDMAKMKSEFLNGWFKKHRRNFSEKLFSNPTPYYKKLAWIPGSFRPTMGSLMSNGLAKKITGVDSIRTQPAFAKESGSSWFRKQDIKPSNDSVMLFVDQFTDYHDPNVVKAAVKVLEELGYFVQLAGFKTAGRAEISGGMLSEAKKIMEDVRKDLFISQMFSIPVVGLEPSEVLTIKDEYLDLCEDADLESFHNMAKQVYLFEDFVANKIHPKGLQAISKGKGKSVAIHTHCHAKSLVGHKPTKDMFEKLGFAVETWDAGCCGMAGSFGYRDGNGALSLEIGELRLFPKVRASTHDFISAHGFSCRHQIFDGTQTKSWHPAEIVASVLG